MGGEGIHNPSDISELDTYLDAIFAYCIYIYGEVAGLDGDAMRGTDNAALAATALSTAVWTAARAGYLDELAAANIPADIDTLLSRLTALRAGYLDELGPTNIPADIDTIITNQVHIPQFTGDIWYVDGDVASSGDGTTPIQAFKTITEAFAAWSAGDRTVVKAGVYNEDGLVMSLDGTELWFEIGGSIINTTPGTCLQVTGDYCLLSGIVTSQAGQVGFDLDGDGAFLQDCVSAVNAVGFDLDGSRCTLTRCRDQAATVTGYDIAGASNTLFMCNSLASGGTSRGFYLSHDDAHLNMLYQCLSNGNTVSSFETVTGADVNVFVYCNVGNADGSPIDAGTGNLMDIKVGDLIVRHEHCSPRPDGEGTAGTPVYTHSEINDETGADSTRDYWGDVSLLMAPAAVTVDWLYLGVNISAKTTADDQRFEAYRVVHRYSATRNGGNAWNAGATVLTVQDATEAAQFTVGDTVWVRSPGYHPSGELVKVTDVTAAVITIARNTENSGRTGLHWNYTTNDPGNEVMYLAASTEKQFEPSQFDYAAGSSKDFMCLHWTEPRRMSANDGLVVRMINGSDDLDTEASLVTIWREW